MKEIVFVYYKTQFVEYTISYALANIAHEFGYKYTEHFVTDAKLELEPSNDETLVFFFFDSSRNQAHFDELRRRRPNLKIIQFGGDMHYFNIANLNMKNIDIHLDPIKKVDDVISEIHRKPTAHWYWSISETVINHINYRANRQDFAKVDKELDLICLCNVSGGMYGRTGFFNNIANEQLKLACNLKLYDFDAILDMYAKSHFTLGTTTSCIEGLESRSMKGFRDWIGPFVGSLLIYDDYPDAVAEWKQFVPIYRYGNAGEVAYIVNWLKNDKETYDHLIEQQKNWALENTIEKQFTHILTENNIL